MTQKDENRHSSNKMLKELFIRNAAAIAMLPRIMVYVTEFNANCDAIDGMVARQGLDKSGLKTNKETQRITLSGLILDVSKRMLAYATIEEIATLKAEAKVTVSELKKLADTKLKAKGQGIYELAKANAAALAEFGVTEAVLTALLDAITAYDEAIPQPKLGIDELKQLANNLKLVFKRNEELLKKIDALVELVKAEKPDFYNSYKNLRKIVPLGRRLLALKGLVKNPATGAGIPKVKVMIEPEVAEVKAAAGPDLAKTVKRTSDKGGFNLSSLAEGVYIITASKPGYTTEVKKITVVSGERTDLNIDLAPE